MLRTADGTEAPDLPKPLQQQQPERQLTKVSFFGREPAFSDFPLPLCGGDCDGDVEVRTIYNGVYFGDSASFFLDECIN